MINVPVARAQLLNQLFHMQTHPKHEIKIDLFSEVTFSHFYGFKSQRLSVSHQQKATFYYS